MRNLQTIILTNMMQTLPCQLVRFITQSIMGQRMSLEEPRMVDTKDQHTVIKHTQRDMLTDIEQHLMVADIEEDMQEMTNPVY